MEIRKPRVCREGVKAAYEQAQELVEPVFAPASYFVDERGFSLMNLLVGVLSPEGQVNYSVQHPGVVKAWHRHAKQTDFWLCLHGHIKVGVYREDAPFAWMAALGEKAPGALVIPPPLWHGAATIGGDPAGLLYFVTRAYDPSDPDEERRAFDSVAGFPWGTRHG